VSHRYDDMRAWLNSEPALRELTRESVWTRPLTNTEKLALGVAWLAGTAAVLVFGVVVLRW
jgi:hypothetical protein